MVSKNSEELTRLIGLVSSQISKDDHEGISELDILGSTISIGSKKGPSREGNQDRVTIVEIKNQYSTNSNLVVAVLADGMGGMIHGKEAASLSVSTFILYIALSKADGGLKKISTEAAEYANRLVFDKYNGKGGATLSAIVFGSKGCVAVNVGDSRIYYLNRDRNINQITKDDTIKEQIGKSIEKDNVWRYPSRMDNRLAQHVGMGDGMMPHSFDLSIMNNKSKNDGLFMITSDGTHYIGKVMIQQIFDNCKDFEKFGERVVDVAEFLSGHDNMSIIAIPANIIPNNGNNAGFTEINVHTPVSTSTFVLDKKQYFVRHDHNNEYDRDFINKDNKLANKNPVEINVANKDKEVKMDVKEKDKKENFKDKKGCQIDIIDFQNKQND